MLFIGQAANSRTPFSIQDWSSKSVLPETEWERLIADKIGRTNFMIVLVGRSTSLAFGVVKEREGSELTIVTAASGARTI